MKESRFIAQNKEKWDESENLLRESSKDPEKLSNLFTQVVDDLSYSRTYYRNRSVRVYLNFLARNYFSIIYSHKKERKNRFRLFWLDELPQLIIHCRRQLLISLAVFLLSMAIGVFSAARDPQFTQSILSPEYIAMTKENIKKGDPMAVYKHQGQADMFLYIAKNNLQVAFITYVLGILLAIGSIGALVSNGIMVGCFQYFFVQNGLFRESALTIWLHGTLEISSIILAGGAGITLGSGLLFPGTYSRLQSFQASAMRSLKLMLGIVPVILLAACIESFLTRFTQTPDFVRLGLIILSAGFIIGYFILYPWYKSRAGFEEPITFLNIQPEGASEFEQGRVNSNAAILQEGFIRYKKLFNLLLPWVVLVSVTLTCTLFFLPDVLSGGEAAALRFHGDFFVLWMGSLFQAMNMPHPLFILINGACAAVLVECSMRLFAVDDTRISGAAFRWTSFLNTLVITTAVYGIIYGAGVLGALLITFTSVLFLLAAFCAYSGRQFVFSGVLRMFRYLGDSLSQVLGLQAVLTLILICFLLLTSAPLLFIGIRYIKWNFAETDTWIKSAMDFLIMFIRIFLFNLFIPFLAICTGLLWKNLEEIKTAGNLRKSIASVGAKLVKAAKG